MTRLNCMIVAPCYIRTEAVYNFDDAMKRWDSRGLTQLTWGCESRGDTEQKQFIILMMS
jgi:hypothetical protein